jgi:hypothetical protein
MKRIQRILLMASLTLCAGSDALAQSSSPQTASTGTQTASDDQKSFEKARLLLQQAIDALGGPAYLGVRDMQQQGRTYTLHHGQSTSNGIQFWRFVEPPDKERVELTKERDVADVFTGDKGYEITYKGVRSLEAKDVEDYLRRRKFSLDIVLRTWFNAKGVAIFYEGMAMSGTRPAEQVTLVTAANDSVTILLDPSTHLPVGKRFSWRDPVDKQRNIEEETYDNYRLVGGIMTAFNITRFFNGDMTNQRFLNSASYNDGLPAAMFDPNSGYSPNKQPGKK